MEYTILPCPFCGGEGVWESDTACYGHGDYARVVRVRCTECGCASADVDDRDYEAGRCISFEEQKTRAIAKWNRRVNGNTYDDGLEPMIRFFKD